MSTRTSKRRQAKLNRRFAYNNPDYVEQREKIGTGEDAFYLDALSTCGTCNEQKSDCACHHHSTDSDNFDQYNGDYRD